VDAAKNFMDSLANAIAETGTNTNIKDTIKLDIPIESIYIDADGNIVVVSTNPDGSTTETVLTPDGELNNTVVQDADGNVYVVDENNGTQNVAQEFTGYGMQENIIISEENIKTIKNQIIVELIDSIKSKIDINAYSGTNRKYLEGAINQTDYIINNTNIVTYSNMGAVGWYEEGKLYIMYTGNETKDDVKATLFHEYLHHINYLYKFFPYRYSNEDRRDIYVKEDSCFYFGKKTLQGIYGDFILTLGYRVVDENWPDKYSDLEENQKQEVLAYKEQNKDQYNKEICTLGIYRPSNYYRDELSVYEICLTLDGILFNISESKKSIYFDNKSKYEEAIQLSVKFENNNNIKEDGYEK
jgi:hypothetical protein